jgi:tetratricopeptide (TPR) repeat protein
MMKSLRLFSAFLVLAGVLPLSSLARSADVPDPLVIEQENLLRREAETKIQEEILNRILGEGLATALVNVEITLQSQRQDSATSEGKVEDRKGLGDQDFILPWVPAPKSVNKANEVPKDAKMESASGGSASATVRQSVTRFDVTIIHDESVGEDKLKLVEDTIRSAYVRFQQVLRILFKPTRFAKFEMKQKIKEGFWDFLKPQYLLPGLIALLLLFFLFGPLWQFLRAILKAVTARKGADMSSDSTLRMENLGDKNKDDKEKEDEDGEGDSAGGGAGALTNQQEENKYLPFAYIDEKNLKRLIYLVRKEPPDVIALVASYLKPELVREVLVNLPAELQAKVAMHMAMVKQMTEEEVRSIDLDIKKKIDFLVGGLHSFLEVLNRVDYKTRDNILEYLKNERPHLYEKIRRHILTFEDLPNVPDQAVQVVVRELRAENLAKALRDAPPEITEKFFKNMSKGASALLKEEMDFVRSVTQELVDEERQKILDTIRRLEAEGKIAVGEKVADDFLEWEDMDVISRVSTTSSRRAAPAAPDGVQEYVRAGSDLYAAQNYEDAAAYFQYASQLDPDSSEIRQYLGNCYYALGRTQDALAAFEQAFALNPGNADLGRWLEEFRAGIGTSARA